MIVNFDWDTRCSDSVTAESAGLVIDAHEGRVRKYKWPKTVWRDWFRCIEQQRRVSDRIAKIAFMTAEELASMPHAPTTTFTVDEVRAMEPFSGVYFAFNGDGSCHYVGEAIDVTKRVSRARAEIGERSIGVIKCERHDRKRIESYFIGLLDPPGNSQSTHYMKTESREARGGK